MPRIEPIFKLETPLLFAHRGGAREVPESTLKGDKIDLSIVPKEEDRQLLLLSDFLGKFSDIPLNIEMKKSFKRKINNTDRRGLKDNIRAFTDIQNIGQRC